MDQVSITCPHCGAMLKDVAGNSSSVHCEYCGTLVRAEGLAKQAPQQPTHAPQPVSSVPTSVPAQIEVLPAEYSQLKRPRPSSPLYASGAFSSGCSLIFAVVWILFSAIFPLIGLGTLITDFSNYNRLLREGLPAQATVTKLDVDDSGDSNTYYVYYQFRAMANNEFSQFELSKSIPSSLYDNLEVGQKINILYAASDPTLTAVKSEFGPPNPFSSLSFIGIGSLFVLIGIWMLYQGLSTLKNLNLLRLQGRQTLATIFDRWQDKDSDGNSLYFVAFVFKVSSLTGERQIITHAEQNKDLYNKYQIGQTCVVRYLPTNPYICQAKI